MESLYAFQSKQGKALCACSLLAEEDTYASLSGRYPKSLVGLSHHVSDALGLFGNSPHRTL